MSIKINQLTKDWVAERIPTRVKVGHKGTFGSVLAFAGSKNFPGAAYLCCAASYKVGAGLVTLATESEVKMIVAKKLSEVTFILPDEIFRKLPQYDVFLLGPGLGPGDKTAKLLEKLLLDNSGLPITIIDADGLNLLSQMKNWWSRINGDTILTPHPGEMSKLTGLSIEKIQADRVNVAGYYAKVWNKIVVLKGANTVIASPTGMVLISPFVNPVLATAGTGDILAGIMAGMVDQGLKAVDAAGVGVYVHGLAGEMLAQQVGFRGGLASELLSFLPQVFKKLS